MHPSMPVRLGPAEETLIAQLESRGAGADAERIRVAGLPTRRVEAYHYTDLKTLLRQVPPLAEAANDGFAAALDVEGAFRLALVNGQIAPHGEAPVGVIVGHAEGSALTLRDDVLVHLNAALAGTRLNVTIEGTQAQPILVDRRIEGAAAHAASSLRVFAADGAKATIVEVFSSSDAAHLGNHATYLALGHGADVTHVTVNLMARGSTHFATNEYLLSDGAQLRTLVINAGADLARTQIFARMAGAGAHARVTGMNLVSDGQHADITMETRHAVANTSSQPLFKSIARGRSHAVVQGKLIVERDAQKTDAKFMHQGLMLSDEAEILSKPELEIYADDVVCGHGSTCGTIDEDSLFYLLSRGIPRAEAETMLVRGFLAELVDPIEHEALAEALNAVVDGWLLTGG
jgi:Fe-S cluster assembly protein SufD